MKLEGIVLCLYFSCGAFVSAQTGSVPALKPEWTASPPLHFIANAGQADARALYYARTPGYILWLTGEGLVFDRAWKDEGGRPGRSVSKLVFENRSNKSKVTALDSDEYRVSYFFGRDESEWKTDIPTSRAVLYENLYEGIDLKIYGSDGQIEYDWIVRPGADPDAIRLAYAGGQEARLDKDGNLAVATPAGAILHRKPAAHQVVAGRRVAVDAAFRDMKDGCYGFEIGAYDPARELTIDPLVLAYSTYLGGYEEDLPYDLVLDASGAIYVGGRTMSRDFPPATQNLERKDIFITKMSPDGRKLIYTAFFPQSGWSDFWNLGLAVDAKGFVYVCGSTTTARFPVKNAFQSRYGGGAYDGFFLKLAKSGKSLVYSSYLGGMKMDYMEKLALDADGAVYLVGGTESRDFPTLKAYQKGLAGYYDGFLTKVAPEGTSLEYSTFLGVTGIDWCNDVVIRSDGGVTVMGTTSSRSFPLKSPFQKAYGGGDADMFIARFSPSGNSLSLSSYLGGSGYEWPCGMAMDAQGAVYVVGSTDGSYPLKNAFQKTRKGAWESYLTKVAPDGKSLVYSSFLGGAGNDYGSGIAVDDAGRAYVVGQTEGSGFPLKSPFQVSPRGSADGFLTVVDASGLKLVSSTYLGGAFRDLVSGIVLGPNGTIYLTGQTNSPDFPVLGGYQNKLDGKNDGFVLKFSQGNK